MKDTHNLFYLKKNVTNQRNSYEFLRTILTNKRIQYLIYYFDYYCSKHIQ